MSRAITKPVGVLFALLLLAVVSAAAGEEKIIAVVNGEFITIADYRRYMTKVDPVLNRETVDEKRLEKLIEERLILQDARKKGYAVTDAEVEKSIQDFLQKARITPAEFEEKIRSEGMGLEEYKRWLKDDIILLAKFLDAEVDAKVEVTEEDLKRSYEENKRLYLIAPEKMTVQAIFMRTEEMPSLTEATDLKIRILRIYSAARKGEPFDRLSVRYSDGPLRERNGALGEFGKGELMPVLDQRISGMKEGEVSSPVWTREGVYILKLAKRTETKYTSLETVQDRIFNAIFKERRERIYLELVKTLWNGASVQHEKQ